MSTISLTPASRERKDSGSSDSSSSSTKNEGQEKAAEDANADSKTEGKVEGKASNEEETEETEEEEVAKEVTNDKVDAEKKEASSEEVNSNDVDTKSDDAQKQTDEKVSSDDDKEEEAPDKTEEAIKDDGVEMKDDETVQDEAVEEDEQPMEEDSNGPASQDEVAPPSTDDNEEAVEADNDDPFKRPPDSVGIDGAESSSSAQRERHESIVSVDSVADSQLSETTSAERRQSITEANEDWAAQYAQQLSFYRKPIVGPDTVCIFCLTRCGSKTPKILTCLHSACDECFKERLEAANKENKDTLIDEDGISTEVVVACPLCKVTTTASEIADNLFLASDDLGDDDLMQTHMCGSCEENNFASSFCADCEGNLCDDCVKAHMRLKITKDHKITPIEINTSGSRSVTASAGTPHDLRCKVHGEKLLLFCETCEVLTCKDCQLSEKHSRHQHRETHEVVPDVKATLNQAASDVRLKRNVLDENRSLLGTKLSEVNIKEKSLMTQLQDLKAYLITKLDGRFRELTNEVSKIVREKRKAIEGRKSVLERYYVQADYALAFVDYSLQFSDSDDKALLVAKRPMERQLRRLKRVDGSTGLLSESSLKLDLYFQQYASQAMHASLESVIKQVLNDVRVLSGPPPLPPMPMPQAMAPRPIVGPGGPAQGITQAMQMLNHLNRPIQGSSRSPSASNSPMKMPMKRSPSVTPTKNLIKPGGGQRSRGSPISAASSRGRIASSPVRGGRGSMIINRGRGTTPVRGGVPAGRGVPGGSRGTPGRGVVPGSRGVVPGSRGALHGGRGMGQVPRGMPSRGRVMTPAGRGSSGPSRGGATAAALLNRGGLSMSVSRVGHPQQMTQAQRGSTAAAANALSRGGAISIMTVRDAAPKPPPPLRASPQMSMRPMQPQQQQQQRPPLMRPQMAPGHMGQHQQRMMRNGQMQPQYGQVNSDPYTMAAYGQRPGPPVVQQQSQVNAYGAQNMQHQHQRIMHQQQLPGGGYPMAQRPQHPQQMQQPQISPGSSWHTPQGYNVQPMASQAQVTPDNSFKITIPSRNVKPSSASSPDIVTLDLDGAPVFGSGGPPRQQNEERSFYQMQGANPMMGSNFPASSYNPASSGNAMTITTVMSPVQVQQQMLSPFQHQPHQVTTVKVQNDADGVPDLSSLLEVEDWMNQVYSTLLIIFNILNNVFLLMLLSRKMLVKETLKW
jgi:hypothetical protein